jgi:membrane protein required for colicin V production
MEGFTLVDGIVALVIVLSAILAYSRGFVRELMAIAGWVAAAILAFLFAEPVRPLMLEVPYVGQYLQGSCQLSTIAAFVAVFAVALVLASIFTPLFSSAIQNSAIGTVDQVMGFIFGVARGVLLVAVAFIIYDQVVVGDAIASVDQSRTAAIFARAQDDIEAQMPEDAPGWVVSRYEDLVSSCTES